METKAQRLEATALLEWLAKEKIETALCEPARVNEEAEPHRENLITGQSEAASEAVHEQTHQVGHEGKLQEDTEPNDQPAASGAAHATAADGAAGDFR